ncbi:hypothetical protein SAMN05216276_108610 [Streptosporangium subroseum]|uniref:Uncharacterized protein n=1 Tax=Streptosporangium subroseum TaxID=106412 RepID=A0A239P432_9ACTN|nr:DUF6166 domain-containing protein [Streptosporangium subroseum]SNT61891.1 hypothetical protein SAMN05216276_108610 [Streptosporangium subroseum]
MTKWAYDEDRTYHGVWDRGTGESWIEAELAEYGPTERLKVIVLRRLEPTGEMAYRVGEMGWGYNGGGTSAAASAILADALGQEPSSELREAFCEDVLSQFMDEWRLRRGAVLRWVRGWCAQHNVTDLPDVVAQLPPVDSYKYGERPAAVTEQQHRRVSGKPGRPIR